MLSLSMLTRRLFFLLLVVGLLSPTTFATGSRQEKARPDEEQTSLLVSKVAGVKVSVAWNNVRGRSRLQSRWIYLVIEAVDFTKENLHRVFVGLAAEYDQPLDVNMFAYSNLDLVRRVMLANYLTDAVEPSGASRTLKALTGIADEPETGHFRAYYNRSRMEEVFWYSPDPASKEMVKVILSSESSDTYTGSPSADLVRAATRGDSAKIQELLTGGTQVNGKDERGNTALIEAARRGQTNAIEILLAAGADVNTRAPSGSTALIEAAYAGHSRVVELLLDRRAEINIQNRQGISALAAAVGGLPEDIVRTLLIKGADPNAKAQDGKRPLLRAVEAQRGRIVFALLSSGADVNATDDDGRTCLMLLATDIEILQHLIRAGAEVNASDKRGWTALMYAADFGSENRLRALLAAGADVNRRNANGETALHVAKKYRGNRGMIELLKKRGARE